MKTEVKHKIIPFLIIYLHLVIYTAEIKRHFDWFSSFRFCSGLRRQNAVEEEKSEEEKTANGRTSGTTA